MHQTLSSHKSIVLTSFEFFWWLCYARCAYIGWGEEEACLMDLDDDGFVTLAELLGQMRWWNGEEQRFRMILEHPQTSGLYRASQTIKDIRTPDQMFLNSIIRCKNVEGWFIIFGHNASLTLGPSAILDDDWPPVRFQRFVGDSGGLSAIFEHRRQRVARKQWGAEVPKMKIMEELKWMCLKIRWPFK